MPPVLFPNIDQQYWLLLLFTYIFPQLDITCCCHYFIHLFAHNIRKIHPLQLVHLLLSPYLRFISLFKFSVFLLLVHCLWKKSISAMYSLLQNTLSSFVLIKQIKTMCLSSKLQANLMLCWVVRHHLSQFGTSWKLLAKQRVFLFPLLAGHSKLAPMDCKTALIALRASR